jgi:hypothetical protein
MTLEQRGKQAQVFDEVWTNMLKTLKTGFLPVLEGINWFLGILVKPLEMMSNWGNGLKATVSLLLVGLTGFLGKLSLLLLKKGSDGLMSKIGMGGLTKSTSPVGGGGTTSPASGGGGGLLSSLKGIDPKTVLSLGAAMLMVAGATWIFSQAIQEVSKIEPDRLGSSFGVLAGAIGVMGITLGVLGATLGPISPLILAIGGAMLMMGGAVWLITNGLSYLTPLVDSIFGGLSKLFTTLSDGIVKMSDAGWGLTQVGVGLLSISAGISALGVSSILGIPALMMLGSVTGMLVGAASALQSVNFEKTMDSITNLDTSKIEMLTKLADALKSSKPLVVEFKDMNIDGELVLKGSDGGKVGTDWLNDPIFISKLKSVIQETIVKDKNGGKA